MIQYFALKERRMSEGRSPNFHTGFDLQGGDPVLARLREYAARNGRTPELRKLRDRLEWVFEPGWDPIDLWDPSHGGYGVGRESLDHGF
jgi:hypothetical protein